jgi:hypothetical protein
LRGWLVGWLALLLVACNASPNAPVAIGDIPVPPGVELYEGAAESTLDLMVVTLALAQGEQGAPQEIRYYWLPPTLPREAVDAFYTEQLPTQGWTASADSALSAMLWTRPSQTGEQRLALGQIPLPGVEGNILLMVLVTPESR